MNQRYIVVVRSSQSYFEEEVSKRIANGAILLGGVSIATDGTNTTFAQALLFPDKKTLKG